MKFLCPAIAYILLFVSFLGLFFSSLAVIIGTAILYWGFLAIAFFFLLFPFSPRIIIVYRGVPTAIVAAIESAFLLALAFQFSGRRLGDEVSAMVFMVFTLGPTHLFLFAALIPLAIRLFNKSVRKYVILDFVIVTLYIASDVIYLLITSRSAGNGGPLYYFQNHVLQGKFL